LTDLRLDGRVALDCLYGRRELGHAFDATQVALRIRKHEGRHCRVAPPTSAAELNGQQRQLSDGET
jgi:hypothetical protein